MYLKQTTLYDCGPVAVLNYFSWRGYPVSEKDIPQVRHMLGTKKKGTSALTIYSAINSMRKESCFCIGMSGWKMVNKHYNNGRPVLIAYGLKDPHIVFTIKQDKRILVTNMSIKQGHILMTKGFLKALLQRSNIKPIFILG